MQFNKTIVLGSVLTLTGVLLSGCGAIGQKDDSGYSKLEDASKPFKKQKVVYHVNDVNMAFGAMRNATNHLDALGDKNVDLVVLTHSTGIFSLVDGQQDTQGRTFETSVQGLAARGVKFEICGNTLRGNKVDKNKINVNAVVVQSGVARLGDLQQRGYLYIRP